MYYLVLNATSNSSDNSIARIESFQDENEWYWSCVEQALQCDFYFAGNNETAPVFDPLNAEDNVKFTYNIMSRTYDSVGVLNSNGEATSFIFVDGEQSMKEWNDDFTTYQFKPSGTSPSGIMHETFQDNSELYVNGKCVKVYITSWQVLDEEGNVVENVNEPNEDSCIVFRTGILDYDNEADRCSHEYDACDFMFEGHENVPTYTLYPNMNDVGFTDVVVPREGSGVGTMNSNGRYTSFILGGDEEEQSGEVTMNEYISDFTPYQFKPDGQSVPRIMHETFQAETDARGKCVKVYFTQYQSLDSEGNVVENVETDSASSCVVFKTAGLVA
jgi:hypothetical protein